MRPPKDIWTNNYNDFILDLYDANPFVQKDNGTVKKAPEPDKNPRKVEATPEESNGTLTTLVNESLRLRNTSLLNVKLAKNIFKWEKERLAKIKPFPDPDSLDGKKVVVIEDDDDGGFKFPKFKFPKFRRPRFKLPKKGPKTSPKTGPRAVPPIGAPVSPKPVNVLQGIAAALSGLGLTLLRELVTPVPVQSKTRVKPPGEIPQRKATPQVEKVPQVERAKVLVGKELQTTERARTVGGGDVYVDGGGGSTGNRPRGGRSTLLENRPDGPSSGSSKKVPKKGNVNVDPSKLKEVPDSAFSTPPPELDDVFRQAFVDEYKDLPLKDIRKELRKLEKARNIRNIALGKKGRIGPTIQEQVLRELDLSKSGVSKFAIPDSPLDLLLNQSLATSANEMNAMKALPGSDPNAPKLPSKAVTNVDNAAADFAFDFFMDDVLSRQNRSFGDALIFQQSYLKGSEAELRSPLTNLIGKPPLGRRVLNGLSTPTVRKSGFIALDVGLTAADFALRKGAGQSDVQAAAGAGAGLAGGVAGGYVGGTLATMIATAIVTPEPISTVAGILLAAGLSVAGSITAANLVDRATGANLLTEFQPPTKKDQEKASQLYNPLRYNENTNKFEIDPNVKSPTYNTGLVTGPSSRIGGSAEYHIDTKLNKNLSYTQMINAMDALAVGYLREGREIEFSNSGVAGLHWNVNLTPEKKLELIKRVIAAHSHSKSENFYSLDYYTPMIGTNRFDKENSKVEGAPILIPRIEGTTVQTLTDPAETKGYGRYVEVRDEEGNIIMKTGHGDVDYGPADGTIEIKPTSNSEDVKVVTPSSEQKVSSSQINKDITVDPDSIEEEDAMMILNKLSESMQSVGTQSSMPMLLPIPVMMQNNGATIKNNNYNTWGHRIMAGQ